MPTLTPSSALRGRSRCLSTLALLAISVAASAQVVLPPSPAIGSSNPVSAEARPDTPPTKPCIVDLFTNQEFADYSAQTFSYIPPAACSGPWAKVIFVADFTVTAGNQFDRTASIYLGHANIFYGTTAEPGSTLSPSWRVERDITDLSAILTTPQSGEADIYNIVNSTYTGIIYGNAKLEFYPASPTYPAGRTPDIVVPLPDAAGGAVLLNDTASQLSQSVTLPRNVQNAYLDVIAQSQSNDEFWYTCVPSTVTGPLESCGGTAFRETEISIDGMPAGVAPVYPWIYTGGIDPFLWIPITGVQTLNFKPYRVDLTPFAGLLSDGSAHTVALSVFNANGYFLATANLLIFTDHAGSAVTGGILSNTLLAAPVPNIFKKLDLDSSGSGTATVSVNSNRNFTISGYVITSHGKVITTVSQAIDFLNYQKFILSASVYSQHIAQSTTVNSTTTTTTNAGSTVATSAVSYPFTINIDIGVNPDGSESQTVASSQKNIASLNTSGLGPDPLSFSEEEVKSTDTLNFNSSGNFTGNTGAKSSATAFAVTNSGVNYYLSLTAKDGVLTGIATEPAK